MPRKYPQPNALDPLSETAINRRVWAAYLRAGFDRASFAQAMGVRYNLVSHWDTGKHSMSLAHFMRAAELVGLSMDQLAHGHAGTRAPRQPETALSDDGVRALLHELKATHDQIAALGEHRASAAGMLQPFTRTYVTRFCAVYKTAVDGGKPRSKAIALAMVEAVNARAQVAALDAGRKPLLPAAVGGEGKTGKIAKPRKRALRVHVERARPSEH